MSASLTLRVVGSRLLNPGSRVINHNVEVVVSTFITGLQGVELLEIVYVEGGCIAAIQK